MAVNFGVFDNWSYVKVRKKANIRNQYNQLPQLTWDTISESDKNTRKHHTQESKKVRLCFSMIMHCYS